MLVAAAGHLGDAGAMEPAVVHVVAAVAVLPLGAAVLLAAKGTGTHVALGRLYVVGMLLVSLPALLVYDITGRPGLFHVLAVVSLVTLGLGWVFAPSRGTSPVRAGMRVHATFMSWSFIGLVTAGLAQLANSLLHEWTPWPVVGVLATSTVAGLLWLPGALTRTIAGHRTAAPVRRLGH